MDPYNAHKSVDVHPVAMVTEYRKQKLPFLLTYVQVYTAEYRQGTKHIVFRLGHPDPATFYRVFIKIFFYSKLVLCDSK